MCIVTYFVEQRSFAAIIRLKEFLTEGEKKKWNIRLYQFKDSASYRDTFWKIKLDTKVKGKKAVITDHQIVLDVPRKHLYDALKAVSLSFVFILPEATIM